MFIQGTYYLLGVIVMIKLIKAATVGTLVLSSIVLHQLAIMKPVYANPYTDPVWDRWNQIKLENQRWWNSLSARQQGIVHATNQILENSQQQTGQAPYPNQENTIKVMQMIGANNNEYSLVFNAINTNYQYFQATQQGYSLLNDTQNFLNCLNSGQLNCY